MAKRKARTTKQKVLLVTVKYHIPVTVGETREAWELSDTIVKNPHIPDGCTLAETPTVTETKIDAP